VTIGPSIRRQWFDDHVVQPSDWQILIAAVPLGRIYLVADEARRRADVWSKFADALQQRVRGKEPDSA
jgi:hypothetical protein